jgi:drug/metabolite transporter (DMT)-like permease
MSGPEHSAAPSRHTRALVSLILVMVVWGSTYAITKAVMREIPPLTLAVMRYLIAAGVLADRDCAGRVDAPAAPAASRAVGVDGPHRHCRPDHRV